MAKVLGLKIEARSVQDAQFPCLEGHVVFRFHLQSLFAAVTAGCILGGLNCVPSAWRASEWNMVRSNMRSWGWPLMHYAEFDQGFIAPMPLWWDCEPQDTWFIPIAAYGNALIGAALVVFAGCCTEWTAGKLDRRRRALRMRQKRLADRQMCRRHQSFLESFSAPRPIPTGLNTTARGS